VGLDQALSAAHPGTLPRMGPKPLADALEALLAAIYLDAQATGAEADALIRSLIEQRFLADIRAAVPEALTRLDPKTHLQETAARLGLASPVYSLLGQSGPDHALRFRVRVAIGDLAAEAEGMTRKRAEGTAAKGLLDILGTRTK
jgi:ribonuclease-3